MPTRQTLKILSYNIHKGFDLLGRKYVLSKIKKAIHDVHADLVLLQEVQGAHSTQEGSQFEFLAESLWPHFAYGKNAVYTEGHHGNAILSKFPIISWENIDISAHRLESRGVLHATLELPHGKPLHALCVHLGLFEGGRRKQLDSICKRIRSHIPEHEPLVLAGDFNDWRQSASQVLQKDLDVKEAFSQTHGKYARSYPSILPALPLDRVYTRGLEIMEARALTQSPWPELSDHAPLWVKGKLIRTSFEDTIPARK